MATPTITFDTEPRAYRHWELAIDAPVATLTMRVTPDAGLRDDYELKLNSYDLSVDIELYDAVQRLRFEHPEVKAVVVTGGLDKVFCAGANIQMLAGVDARPQGQLLQVHQRDPQRHRGRHRPLRPDVDRRRQRHRGRRRLRAGAGVRRDRPARRPSRRRCRCPRSRCSPCCPGTGGLTRLVDKRYVRRDLADVFATRTEGVKGQQAVEWGLVDAIAPRSRFDEVVRERALAARRRVASPRRRPRRRARARSRSRSLPTRCATTTSASRSTATLGAAHITVHAPTGDPITTPDGLVDAGAAAWLLAAARQLDDAILRLRFNEPDVGTWVLHTAGDAAAVLAAEELLGEHAEHWLVNEVRRYWARTLKRLDVSARTLVALIEPGSCFAGLLAELALAADRSFMLDGTPRGRRPAAGRRSG